MSKVRENWLHALPRMSLKKQFPDPSRSISYHHHQMLSQDLEPAFNTFRQQSLTLPPNTFDNLPYL